MNYWAST